MIVFFLDVPSNNIEETVCKVSKIIEHFEQFESPARMTAANELPMVVSNPNIT